MSFLGYETLVQPPLTPKMWNYFSILFWNFTMFMSYILQFQLYNFFYWIYSQEFIDLVVNVNIGLFLLLRVNV